MKVSMTDESGMLPNHRKLEVTSENRIGNMWEIRFGEAELIEWLYLYFYLQIFGKYIIKIILWISG